ncbi:Membrane-fusion protein (fragment) [Candidatus Terasakiella magnetica]
MVEDTAGTLAAHIRNLIKGVRPMRAVVLAGALVSLCAGPTWTQELRGQLSPSDVTTLTAEMGAAVEQVRVREGERFSRKQVLITFDCTINRMQLDEARAAQSAADKTLAVNKRLLELQIVGKLEMDISVAESEKARAKVAAMSAMVSKCAVTAPFDGRVIEQKVREQQYVKPGQALLDISR